MRNVALLSDEACRELSVSTHIFSRRKNIIAKIVSKILTILASYGVHPPQGTEFLTRGASANNRLDIQRRYATLKLPAIALNLPSNCHKQNKIIAEAELPLCALFTTKTLKNATVKTLTQKTLTKNWCSS